MHSGSARFFLARGAARFFLTRRGLLLLLRLRGLGWQTPGAFACSASPFHGCFEEPGFCCCRCSLWFFMRSGEGGCFFRPKRRAARRGGARGKAGRDEWSAATERSGGATAAGRAPAEREVRALRRSEAETLPSVAMAGCARAGD